MITSNVIALDNLGWTDHGAIWTYHFDSGTQEILPIPDSKYLSLTRGKDDLFRVVHHGDPSQAISIRSFQQPTIELASVRRYGSGYSFVGNTDLWESVDDTAIINLSDSQQLVVIDAPANEVRQLNLDWYNAEAYDLGYQGLVGCISLPNRRHIAVAVQRSSDLVIVERSDGKVASKITLSDGSGNPSMQLLSDREMLAVDYDTLCRVDLVTGQTTDCVHLQTASPPFDRQFIGDFTITPAGHAAVARPFSGDVVLVNLDRFEACGRKMVGDKPMTIGCGANGVLITRDWKSGEVRKTDWRA